MKSFNMLISLSPDGHARYFIDGKRVSQAEYYKTERQAKRQDTFHSYRFAGRAHNRSVIYV